MTKLYLGLTPKFILFKKEIETYNDVATLENSSLKGWEEVRVTQQFHSREVKQTPMQKGMS